MQTVTDDSAAELLELVLGATNDGLVDHDLTAQVTVYSERFWMLLGYDATPAEVSPASWRELIHPEDTKRVGDAWTDHLEGSWPFDETFRMSFFHGGYRWVRSRSVVTLGQDGAPSRAIMLFTDVTERVAEAARHRAIVEAMPDSLLLMTLDGAVLECRPSPDADIPEITGASRPWNVREVFGEQLAEVLLEAGTEAMARGERVREEVMVMESRRWFEATVAPAGGNRVAVVVRDTTDRKMLEMQLAQAQKLESIGQLSAGIAHEINTPLQYIGDNAHFLRKACTRLLGAVARFEEVVLQSAPHLSGDFAQIRRKSKLGILEKRLPPAIDACIEGVERASGVVSAMKYFSHPGADERSPVNVNDALNATVRVSRGEWKDVAEVELELGDVPDAPCFSGPLKQCFLNLVINATHALAEKHGESGAGRITIGTSATSACVEVRIRDNGPGIPDDVVQRIFDPFFTTKEVGKGTGQGLSICRETIVGRHGGDLFCETRVGEGTTFVVRLPLEVAA